MIKKTIWIVMINLNRRKLGTMSLVIASFLNPFGYDILVYKLTQLTKDYWTTMYILYVFAVLFFILFFICYKINPFKIGFNFIKTTKTKIIKNGRRYV
jgi:hypothetical protein